MTGINADLPPYVTFETRAIEDRQGSIESGRPKFKDIDIALVTPMGSKDRIEVEVQSWFQTLALEVQNNRFEPRWLENFKAHYKAWKEGCELPLEGTALQNWPGLSPSMFKILRELHIRTVEEVSSMNEEALGAVGMGARALKQRAIDWLATADDRGKLSEEMSYYRSENESLRGELKSALERIKKLEFQVDQKENPPSPKADIKPGTIVKKG